MEFKKYNSLENAYRQKFIDQCHELGVDEWVALEKVHGANFSFVVGDGGVIPAKRSGPVELNEHGNYDFYGCHPIVEKYRDRAVMVSEVVGKSVQIFGELYGEGVQKGVDYGPKDFVAFDIMTEDGTYLAWPIVCYLCDSVGIPKAPVLGTGTLTEMLEISPEFFSAISPRDDQKAEGVVIKPWQKDVRFGNGSRPIIKNKSQAFSEKKEKVAKKPYVMPENLVEIYQDFCQYITENRLRNVLSKVGEVSQKDFGKVSGAFVKDAKDEFERDEYEINKDDWKGISKSVGKEASNLIRKHWLNILDNNF